MANDLDKPLTSIEIGSSEGFTQAEKVINNSSKSGRWVLLKNLHHAQQWLVQLEKKIHNLFYIFESFFYSRLTSAKYLPATFWVHFYWDSVQIGEDVK